MTDYKTTLHLPTTDFPMKANLAAREPLILADWQQKKLYQQIRAARMNAPEFILHDGPPYANGNIHIGHAVNKILKDIVLKSKTLSGFNTPYIPGWDCHGLPIELNVEKKLGKPGQKIDAKTFRQACRDYAASQIELQKTSFERLGVLADWQNFYCTMAFHYEANIVRALGEILGNGYLHKGFKPVHWCLDCSSALAEAEVEYQDKTSDAIYVAFEVISTEQEKIFSIFGVNNADKNLPIWIPIWTTTPWTLPANEAVALHPEEYYQLIKTAHAYFLIAQQRVAACTEQFLGGQIESSPAILGKSLEAIELLHPFLNKQVPIILGEHVTIDTGTGAVHTAPAHGQEDYQAGLKYHLLVDNPVLANGCFREGTPYVAGVHVYKANELLIALLQQQQKLLHHEKIQHSFPHCWRHKTPLIFRATPQWFIRMDRSIEPDAENNSEDNWIDEGGTLAVSKCLRQEVLQQIDQVTWLPDWGQARIRNMILSSPDWCISRQRVWGVPITLFVNKHNGQIHPNMLALIEIVAQKIEQNGVEAWFDLATADLLGDDAEDYEKITDVLDVWFDAGVSHYAVLSSGVWPSQRFPADLYLEGSDQHRGWFQSSLRTSVAMHGVAPYKTVLTHGFTVDAHGHKMSKSLGNVIAPEKIMSTLGADILRLWVSSTDYRNEMTVSDEILKRAADAYRRIRNTARYLLANLNDFNPTVQLISGEHYLAFDAWVVEQTQALQEKIIHYYEQYEFHLIYQEIHNFCVNQLGSLYLDVVKDRQYTAKKDGVPRQSAQNAMYHVLQALVRWLAPIIPFTAEEIWSYIPKQNQTSVLLATWYDQFPSTDLLTKAQKTLTSEDWQLLWQLRAIVNKELESARNKGLIGAGLEAEVIIYDPQSAIITAANKLKQELKFLLITSDATLHCAIIPHELTSHEILSGNQPVPLAVQVIPRAEAIKCLRCWHRTESVNKNPEYPGLCTRCISNAFGVGEVREFV